MNIDLNKEINDYEAILSQCIAERNKILEQGREKENRMLELQGILSYLKTKKQEHDKKVSSKK